jgi:hypothetical protein
MWTQRHHGIAHIASGAEERAEHYKLYCAGHGHVLNMFGRVMFPPKIMSSFFFNKLSVKRHLEKWREKVTAFQSKKLSI